jgi:hypothetical protein
MPTPKGGKWTEIKHDISAYLSGKGNITTPQKIIGSTIAATGGLSLQSSAGYSGRSGRKSSDIGSNRIAQTIFSLAGFGTTVGVGTLTQALNLLGIESLEGKSAGEVISRIADHLSEQIDSPAQDILRTAIQGALHSAAELSDDPTYENLEQSLQTFLLREGIEGLIELFLTQYIFDKIWLFIEDYVNRRTDSQTDISNMEVAVEQSCRSSVHDEIEQRKNEGRFNSLDWFGRDGARVADEIVASLEQRLRQVKIGGAE